MTISAIYKRILTLFYVCLLCLLMLSGCGKSNPSGSKAPSLPKATIEEIAKNIFAESVYCQNAVFMSDGDYEFLGISYSNDEYNRYLVCIDLKTSVGMKYETLPIYIFFRYNSSTSQYTWHPQMIFSDEYTEEAFKKAVNWNKEATWKADEDAFRLFLDNIEASDTAKENEPTPDDVNAAPPAEWEEMPLHKCVYCGGTARLDSGAWCCDNCFTVYGEEDFAEKVSFDAFTEGTWLDAYSQRCNLTIDVIDDETITIEINWSSGASENTKWIITAKWDSYWGLLRYENGIKQNINATDKTIVYDDGSGFFYINSGKLYWVDYKESIGFDCVFEFPIY